MMVTKARTPAELRALVADALDDSREQIESARWYYGEAPISELSNGLNALICAVNELHHAVKLLAEKES